MPAAPARPAMSSVAIVQMLRLRMGSSSRDFERNGSGRSGESQAALLSRLGVPGPFTLSNFNGHRSRLVLLRREPPCRPARQRHAKEESAPDHGPGYRSAPEDF